MRDPGHDHWRVVMDSAGVTVSHGSHSTFFQALAPQPIELTLANALDQALAKQVDSSWWRPKNKVHLSIGDELLRLWMTPPPVNASMPHDCLVAAQERLESLFGLESSDWVITAQWSALEPFLCAAIPHGLVDSIHQACTDRKLRIMTMVPRFVEHWNRYQSAFETGDWFAAIGNERLTLATVQQSGRVIRSLQPGSVKVLSKPLESQADAYQWLEQVVILEARRLGNVMPTRVLMCGAPLTASPQKSSTSRSIRFERLETLHG